MISSTQLQQAGKEGIISTFDYRVAFMQTFKAVNSSSEHLEARTLRYFTLSTLL